MNILNHLITDFVRAALMVLLAVVTFPTAAWATNVQYLDANGQSQTANAVAFTSSNADISLDGGWYYVNGNVTINGKITFTGNVNLILCDGASLTVTYNSYPAAINSDNKKNLTIYAQSTGNNMGSLSANGTCCINTGGNITIYGGKVTANSNGYESIGIYAQNVYIFGGQVRATGSDGIVADGNVGIRLQCRNENDYIWVSRFSYLTQAENNGSIQANNLVAYDANTGVIGSVVNGTVTNFSTISGKVLRPIDNWGGDDGTAEHPYVITTTAGLDLLAKKVNGTDGYTANDFSGKYFVLGNDITYSYEGLGDTESNYTAIGVFFSSIKKFEGSFNGQGHTVKGIRICKDGNSNDDDYQGLFGRIGEGGSVSHVTVSDARIIGRRNIGGIVGSNWGGTITDCHVTASVFIKSVQSSAHYHGGIVGFNKTSNGGGIVSGCSSSAVITLANGLGDCQGYGGIVGSNQLGTVKDCLYFGEQVGGNDDVGAIVGYNGDGTIKNCYYTNSDIKGKDIGGNEVTLSNGNPAIGYGYGNNAVVTNVGLARTITLDKEVTIDGTPTDYAVGVTNPKRRITTYLNSNDDGIALRLDTLNGTKTATTLYCLEDTEIGVSYSGGELAEGYAAIVSAKKTEGGEDVTATVISGSTLTAPDYELTLTAPTDVWGIAGGADGSKEHPYVITTTAGLDLLAEKVNGGTDYAVDENHTAGYFFVLGADIDYSQVPNRYDNNYGQGLKSNYQAIGGCFNSVNRYFKGNFNGQGHTVKGITIEKPGDGSENRYQGLFGYVGEGGSVSHVTLDASSITAHFTTGGIAGSNHGTITDCHATADVIIDATRLGPGEHGGIVGDNYGTVSGCTSKARVINTSGEGVTECGGVVGNNATGTIQDCIYFGGQVDGNKRVGAIAGRNNGSIINSYYTYDGFIGKDDEENEFTDNPAIGFAETHGTTTKVGLAHTITLGKDVTISGVAKDYAEGVTNPKRRITTYLNSNDDGIALRLDTLNGTKTDTIYYSVKNAMMPLSYSGTSESGVIFRATKTSGGDDVTSSVIEGSTLTMPDYDVTVRAIDSFDLSFAAANDLSIESGKATVTVDGVDVTLTNGKLTGVKPGSKVTVTAAEGYKFKNAGGERLLTTIKPAGSNAVTPFYVTQGVATLTIVGNDIKNEGYGWVNTSSDDNLLTITPATGYDITSVKFKSDTDSEFALGPTFPIYYPIYRVNLKNSRIKQRVLVYGDYSRSYVMEDLPFRPGSWNAAAMRFSDTDGQHFHFLTDEIYWGFKTLIMDVSDVEVGTTMMVHNGWWTATYYDNLPIVNGPNEIQLTEDIARDCAMVNGAGKDLQFLIKSGNCIVNTVYYEDGYGGTSIKEFNIYGYESGGIKDVTINADSTQFSFIMPMGDVTAFYELELMSFPLTIGANRYATYYSDKPMTLGSEQSFAQLYTIASVGTETVSLSEALTVAKANTPLLVYNSADEEKTVTLYFANGTPDNVTANSAFKGTISDKTFTEAEMNAAQHYVLVGGTTFLRVDKPGTIAANRCWLEVANASARQLTIGDRTLNIKDERFNIDEAGTMYDLQGRRLTKKPTKAGVYVKNGQKVVVK